MTGANGRIARKNLSEFIRTSTSTAVFNNYTINASVSGLNQSRSINLSLSRFEFFTFPAFPAIFFVPPTLPNNSVTDKNFVEINMSIITQELNKLSFNWNGTNYFIYDPSLLLFMNFDNRSALKENATYVADLSIYRNHGICSGLSCPTWNSTGKYGGAHEFDGIDDFIAMNATPLINILGANNYSMVFWIKPRNFKEFSTVFAQRITNDGIFIYAHTTTDVEDGPVTAGLSAEYRFGSGSFFISHSLNNVLSAGSWSHVAVLLSVGVLSFRLRAVLCSPALQCISLQGLLHAAI